MDAKKIWSYARRLLAIIPSIFICALGVALGSSWGIGTLIAVVAYGPIIDRLMGIIEPFSFAVAGMKKENKKGK